MTTNLKEKILAFLSFIALLITLNAAYSALSRILLNEEKSRYSYMARNQANYIAGCIDKVVVRTYTLREMVNENDGGSDFFDKVSETIFQSVLRDTGITLKNVTLAPGGTVEKVYPIAGNESFIGFHYTDESMPGNKEAVETYRQARTLLTNPFNLVQGGFGMAARTPVFLKRDGNDEFWGLVAATMDFSDLLKTFSFENFDKININYRLWYEDDNGNPVVLHQSDGELVDSITEEVSVFNLKWNLELAPEKGWVNRKLNNLIRATIFVVSTLFALLLLLVFRIRQDGNIMRSLAEHDNLTKCYSRYYMNSSMIDINNGSWKDSEANYSIVIVDVDNFKRVNDTYGHFTGDRALISIARILQKSLGNPKKDRVIRFGGDEFLIFYSNVEKNDLKIKFQQILSEVSRIKFDDIPELRLGVSIGAAIASDKASTYQVLMKIADENLYKVKENGRNGFSFG
ncbi:MAG: sensor domain-containing diguanylate cyclase [Treponema sp.]|nr:sensor domain-containing diguanylate cyclase [Treponema sp.]